MFSGIGGLSYGFSLLPEFKIVAANEINENIAKGYELNHPNAKMLCCNIAELNEEYLCNELPVPQIDLIIGGPPCQSYSTLGKRQMDERANLFMQYKKVLSILRPTAFVFENVVGILSMNHGSLFQQIEKEFSELGYSLRYKVLNAADYGVPQMRERVILVGMNSDNNFIFPTPTHGKNMLPYVTLQDALHDLPHIKSGQELNIYSGEADNDFLRFVRYGSTKLTEHKAPKSNEMTIQIMEALKDGQCKNDLPESLCPKSGFPNTYAKLWWNKPATTITRNFACPSSSRCIHPIDSRALTIREGARLQSFPDNYLLYGPDGIKRLEIGNAVPPLLSIEIAKQMLIALNEKEK